MAIATVYCLETAYASAAASIFFAFSSEIGVPYATGCVVACLTDGCAVATTVIGAKKKVITAFIERRIWLVNILYGKSK
jgi:hypothetical protein